MIKMLQRIIELWQPVYHANPTLTPCTQMGVGMMPKDNPLRSQYERMAKHQALIEAEEQACNQF